MFVEQSAEVVFCAEKTLEAGDPLLGTATGVKVWLLLEYRGAWRAKAVKDNDLPPRVQGALDDHLAAIPGSRLLFIKRPKRSQEVLRFYVCQTGEMSPALYEFELDAYEDLLALDIAAAAAGDEAYAGFKREEPLFLVCSNGTRDKCCAQFGLPAYKALQEQQPEAAWQSTHIGGHRYAPNVLFLPHSVHYGFFTPADMGPAAAAYLNGQLYDLGNYRGSTYYAPSVQAADTFLRQELNLLDLSGVRLRSAEVVEEDSWRIRFYLPASGEVHQILLQTHMTLPQLISCSSPVMKPVSRYRLIEHKVVPG